MKNKKWNKIKQFIVWQFYKNNYAKKLYIWSQFTIKKLDCLVTRNRKCIPRPP